MSFTPGQTLLRRHVRADTVTVVHPMRVVSDDDAGLLLWKPAGREYANLVDADGKTQHELPIDRMRRPRLVRQAWRRHDILVLMLPQASYSVWWFFAEGGFVGWYVNLETPYVRHVGGVDTTDLLLDVVIDPQRNWRWKDEDELAARVGHPLYPDADTADAVRREGKRLIRLAEDRAYPFDGTHVDFRPDPSWPDPDLPAGWSEVLADG
ncbi:Protein of unknown function [Micromonospora haikouensis]|uniref:DUF402 domain-containing protein n=1 Tax=Micromonospora haikouensis TaxID=686309 RepID=A0A1C4WGN2_9ACTN|nr:DUF402 domain-containing protein [Micromonospora haikouensis]SCE95343.1 Protein of unknown function [Micromonospora haikouensis]